MKLLLTSDTHIGLTTEGILKSFFKKIATLDFDVLVHCGDYCGASKGSNSIKRTLELMRKFIPHKPIITTIGNHDYWYKSGTKRSSLDEFNENLARIKFLFKEYNVHFADYDGVYVNPSFPSIGFMGCSGWYLSANPPTNDHFFLPIGIDGDTNKYLLKLAQDNLYRNEDQLRQMPEVKTLIFVSHFPVVDPPGDQDFPKFCWSTAVADWMIRDYGCKHFLCGHAHQLHEGPLRYESGSDYGKPKYIIMEV